MTRPLILTSAGVQPPLKWAGGKRWLIPYIANRLPPYQRLVEPFMGAMALTLGLAPKYALVNDINPHLVNFFRQVQNDLTFDLPFGHSEADYYAARDRFNQQINAGRVDTPEMANIFYYLNRTGFNGLCRFNGKGFFNVPFGRYSTIHYRTDFKDIAVVLREYQIECKDFTEIDYSVGDFIYIDPPYDTQFTSYSKIRFSWSDQIRTATFFAGLGLPLLASNQATPRIIDLYTNLGFHIETIAAPRRISSSGDRSDALEMLAWK